MFQRWLLFRMYWCICHLLHFVAFFQVASLFSIGVDNKKALELTNSTVFHRGRQWKNSRAGQQNIFFLFWPYFSIKKTPKNTIKHLSCCIVAWPRLTFWYKLNFLLPKNESVLNNSKIFLRLTASRKSVRLSSKLT